MGSCKRILAHVAWSALLVSASLGPILPLSAQQAAVLEKPTMANEFPDSPGTVVAQSQVPPSPQSQSTNQNSAPTQATPSAQTPVGTAAAEAPNTSGVAASQPAGVAIAPAKQRRVRTLVLRMGAIIGAGVAVGTVVALTAGTSSKPPGAH
jgi:hypothetical protein